MDGGPLLYYKLILWAFGSGELKIRTKNFAWKWTKTLAKKNEHGMQNYHSFIQILNLDINSL